MNGIRRRGQQSTPHRDPSDPPRRRANKRKGHGTYANDRPPIISVISHETGEPRFGVCDHADTRPCVAIIAAHVPAGHTTLYTNEWQSYRGSHPSHAGVCHGRREWAWDDDDDGRREVCQGFLRKGHL
jgi:transposase